MQHILTRLLQLLLLDDAHSEGLAASQTLVPPGVPGLSSNTVACMRTVGYIDPSAGSAPHLLHAVLLPQPKTVGLLCQAAGDVQAVQACPWAYRQYPGLYIAKNVKVGPSLCRSTHSPQ